ncbi:hypothetical protein C4572_01875 [Candidatus Parcubacteria bacterium]|nr:MAG: hypothetical protein C4572_01875 [Candidatus Parcubacteria bacterium]
MEDPIKNNEIEDIGPMNSESEQGKLSEPAKEKEPTDFSRKEAARQSISSIKGIRTLEDDIAEYTKGQNFSILDIAAEEAKVRGLSFETAEDKKSFGKLPLVLLAILVMVGGLYFGIARPMLKKGGAEIKKDLSQIVHGPILGDEKVEITADKSKQEAFLRDLREALGSNASDGDIAEISIVFEDGDDDKKSIKKSEFISLIKGNMPQGLNDYLEDDFMLLNHNFQESHPVLIFKTKSYNYVFSEMLGWEKKIGADLKGVFPELAAEPSMQFKDKFIQNRDARVWESQGEELLMYSFIDREYLVITDSRDTLAQIFKRFSSPEYANPQADW